jgi:hypothetical protein
MSLSMIAVICASDDIAQIAAPISATCDKNLVNLMRDANDDSAGFSLRAFATSCAVAFGRTVGGFLRKNVGFCGNSRSV